jgi:hypothetical protein
MDSTSADFDSRWKQAPERYLAKLMRITEPDGSRCLWHIEVQTASQADFAGRMFICYCRLYQRFRLPVRSIAAVGLRQRFSMFMS